MRKYLRDVFRQGTHGRPGKSERRHSQQTGYEQWGSSLMAKLPAELRAQIFYELLGGRRVHIKIMPKPSRTRDLHTSKWRHGICKLEGTPFGPLDDYYSKVESCYYQCLSREARQYLDRGIMFTCRKAYNESVLVLYRTCTFILHAAMPSMSLPAYVRSFQCRTPHTWPHISALELPWSLPWQDRPHYSAEAEQRYRGLWDLLGRMPSLRHLRVAMFMPDCERSPSRQREFRQLYLGPVEALRGLKMCEIAAPWSYCLHFGVKDGDVFFEDAEGGGGKYRLVWMLDANARSEAIVPLMLGG